MSDATQSSEFAVGEKIIISTPDPLLNIKVRFIVGFIETPDEETLVLTATSPADKEDLTKTCSMTSGQTSDRAERYLRGGDIFNAVRDYNLEVHHLHELRKLDEVFNDVDEIE